MHQPTDPRYPSRAPASGSVDDALHELDREMRELQQKMDALRNPQPAAPAAPPSPVVPPPAPAPPPARPPAPPQAPAPRAPVAQPPVAQPPRQSDWVDATTSDLRRLRDNLNRLAQELGGAVDDLLSGIEAMRGRSGAAAQQPAPQQPAPQQPAPQQPAAPSQPAPAMQHAEFGNVVELDAGPFDDLVAVERFKQALGDLPGVEDVYVKAYGRSRAVIELTVDDRQTVVDEMHSHLSYSLDAGPAPDGKVVVHLHAAPPVEQPGV